MTIRNLYNMKFFTIYEVKFQSIVVLVLFEVMNNHSHQSHDQSSKKGLQSSYDYDETLFFASTVQHLMGPQELIIY